MPRRKKHSKYDGKVPVAATKETNLLPIEDFISRKEFNETKHQDSPENINLSKKQIEDICLEPKGDLISNKDLLEDTGQPSSATALVPMLDIYSAKAMLGGMEASLEQRIISLEERMNKRIKERDWKLMERIRQLQYEQSRKRPWWRFWG